MENILREILSKDKTILSRRDELIAALDEKVPSNLARDYTSIKRALNLNIGEIFLVGESDKDATKSKVAEILKSSGMQEARINFVIETFTKALEFDEPQTPEPEETIPPEKVEEKPQPPTSVNDKSFDEPKEIPQPAPPINNPPPVENPPQNVQTQSGVSKNTLIAIIGVLLLVVAFMASNNKSDNRNSPAPSNQVDQNQPEPKITFPADEPDSYTRGLTDLSLNGMDIGITTAELERNLGAPDRIENADGGYIRYYYGDFYAAIKDGIVDAFVSSEPKYKTLRGLSAGSSYNDVINKYGGPSSSMNFEGLILNEYPFRSIDGRRGLLRFAVDRNNRVDYISMRIVEEPAPKSNFSRNVEQAASVFVRYHEAITNKNFNEAFSLFSEERKRSMKYNIDGFSRGYATTITSQVTDLKLVSESNDVVLLNYILDARDRMGGGRILYQQFSGQVEMVRYGGEWKINDTHSTKIKEVMER